METRAFRWLAAILLLVMCLGVTACGTRKKDYAHGHYHDYRHGYYNPVDGYFHDDHWHNSNRTKNRGHAVSYHYY